MASGRSKAFRHHLNVAVDHETSYADVVRLAATGLCRVNPLPAVLEYSPTAEHWTWRSSASTLFDAIADLHGLEWDIRDGALTMTPEGAQHTAPRKATGRPQAALTPFEALAGELMLHATRKGSGHLAAGELERIAAELDAKNIKLHEKVRKWNDSVERKGRAVRSWEEAAAKLGGARRIVQVLIYRAGEKYRSRAA